jgi:hypothetical protein
LRFSEWLIKKIAVAFMHVSAIEMSQPLLKKEIESYKSLFTRSAYDEIYKWEALKTFQDNWNINVSDFRSMFDSSFSNARSSNLWASTHFFPKAVMLRFIEHDQEKVRQMFKDLFNEEEDVDHRLDMFVYSCEQLLAQVRLNAPGMKHHFHDGQRMISVYLAFRFPTKYAIYKYTEFKIFMEKVGTFDIPKTGEFKRFTKVINTIYNILKQDQQLINLHSSLLTPLCYKGETLMLAQDLVFVTARRYI